MDSLVVEVVEPSVGPSWIDSAEFACRKVVAVVVAEASVQGAVHTFPFD